MITNFPKAKANTNSKNGRLTSSGMDIPDYAYERMAKRLLPIMRTYFESEAGKKVLGEVENEDNLRCAA